MQRESQETGYQFHHELSSMPWAAPSRRAALGFISSGPLLLWPHRVLPPLRLAAIRKLTAAMDDVSAYEGGVSAELFAVLVGLRPPGAPPQHMRDLPFVFNTGLDHSQARRVPPPCFRAPSSPLLVFDVACAAPASTAGIRESASSRGQPNMPATSCPEPPPSLSLCLFRLVSSFSCSFSLFDSLRAGNLYSGSHRRNRIIVVLQFPL